MQNVSCLSADHGDLRIILQQKSTAAKWLPGHVVRKLHLQNRSEFAIMRSVTTAPSDAALHGGSRKVAITARRRSLETGDVHFSLCISPCIQIIHFLSLLIVERRHEAKAPNSKSACYSGPNQQGLVNVENCVYELYGNFKFPKSDSSILGIINPGYVWLLSITLSRTIQDYPGLSRIIQD